MDVIVKVGVDVSVIVTVGVDVIVGVRVINVDVGVAVWVVVKVDVGVLVVVGVIGVDVGVGVGVFSSNNGTIASVVKFKLWNRNFVAGYVLNKFSDISISSSGILRISAPFISNEVSADSFNAFSICAVFNPWSKPIPSIA